MQREVEEARREVELMSVAVDRVVAAIKRSKRAKAEDCEP